jgi:hypothetical protein
MRGAAFAVLAVAAAFVGTLYYGGRALGAWGDPGKELVAPPVKALPKGPRPLHVKRASSDWSRWVDAANAHCSRLVGEIASMRQPRDLNETHTFVQRFWQLNKDWTGELATMRAPRGFHPQVARLRVLSARYSSLVDQMLAAAGSGDEAGYKAAAAEAAGVVNAEVDVLARMGADGCVAAAHT